MGRHVARVLLDEQSQCLQGATILTRPPQRFDQTQCVAFGKLQIRRQLISGCSLFWPVQRQQCVAHQNMRSGNTGILFLHRLRHRQGVARTARQN